MSLPLPDDATVTLTVGQLRALVEGRAGEGFTPIGTADAARITGEDPRRLRRLWVTWDRIQAEGGRPEIRVSRKTDAKRSDLLFDRSDCYAYAEARRGEPPPDLGGGDDPPEAVDPNDADAIADRLARSR